MTEESEGPDDEFVREWSARAFDEAQLAQIREIEAHIIRYAMEGWRPMSIDPPEDVLLICATDEGVMLLRKGPTGDWRTNGGVPQRAPRAWMPAPIPPKVNGRGK